MANASDIESVTRRVVDRFTREGFLFTALDISNAVKGSLPGVRHREVAPIVRDLFQDGAFGDDYTRTLIDVTADNGNRVSAYLYHLDEDDPDDYAGSQRQQRAIPPVPVSVLMQPGAQSNQVNVDIGKDGRGRIPRTLLDRAGITSQEVSLEPIGSGPSLLLCDPANGSGVAVARLAFTHPTVLYVPLSLLAGLVLDRPITATIEPRGVRIDGTPRP